MRSNSSQLHLKSLVYAMSNHGVLWIFWELSCWCKYISFHLIKTITDTSETMMKDRSLTLYQRMGKLCLKTYIKASLHIRYTCTLIKERLSKRSIKRKKNDALQWLHFKEHPISGKSSNSYSLRLALVISLFTAMWRLPFYSSHSQAFQDKHSHEEGIFSR